MHMCKGRGMGVRDLDKGQPVGTRGSESNVGLLGVSAHCESHGKERELRCMANYTLSFSDFFKRKKKRIQQKLNYESALRPKLSYIPGEYWLMSEFSLGTWYIFKSMSPLTSVLNPKEMHLA